MKIIYLTAFVFSQFICFSQSSDFIVVSTASTSNPTTFTVGEIFLSGELSSGFLASSLPTIQVVSIDDLESNDTELILDLFPNPTVADIQIVSSSELMIGKRVLVYSSDGILVIDDILKSSNLSLTTLSSGIYIMKIEGFRDSKIVITK